jgi:Domain of unknown function (DUF4386)
MAISIADAGTSPAATRATPGWVRYAWLAGVLFVLAVIAESAIGLGVGINQNDSAARIASALADHRNRLVVVEGFCVVYAAMFPIYLWKLYDRFLHTDAESSRALGSLMLVGGVLFVALHAVSDIGIYGVLDGKLAAFGAHHDPSVSYTLYLLTYAVDSVADVFGSLFAFAAGVLVFRSGVLPRWLGWVSILAAPLLFLQAFGLGGVIASFGLVLDLIGFVLLLVFVLISSVVAFRHERSVVAAAPVG